MRLTVKGQVTIPKRVRDKLGITTQSEIEFVEEGDRVYIVKAKNKQRRPGFRKYRGTARVQMSTDEIMKLTRG